MPKIKESVLVLEAQAKASIPILESCADMGLHVIAGSSKRHCCGFYSRAAKERVLYANPEKEQDKCITFLLDFLRNREISVLFPVGDIMTDLVAKHQDRLRKHTRLILPRYDIFVQGRNKTLTLKAAAKAGCPIPKTWYPQEQPLEKIANEAVYPVLIKPAISAGARGITFCYNRDELLEKFPRIEELYNESFVQEFIPQTGTQYKADIILDNNQKLLAGVVYAKLRYYPPSGGSSILNKTEKRPDILESAIKVLKNLKWVGFCDFDFVTDPRDGIAKLIEINPRYPESYRATVAAGVDMTKLMYQLAMEQNPVPQLDYLEGRYLRFLFGDIMWFLTTKENRWIVKPSFFSFFRRDTIYQLLRAKDWGVIIGYMMENMEMLWNRKLRKTRLR